MTNTCSDCGANLALVGVRHRCVSRAEAKTLTTAPAAKGNFRSDPEPAVVAGRGTRTDRSPANYKYRDADEWRSYMRDYMRKRRGVR